MACWRNSGGILAEFWRKSGGILDTFWWNSGGILAAFWRKSGSILVEVCWNFWRKSGRIWWHFDISEIRVSVSVYVWTKKSLYFRVSHVGGVDPNRDTLSWGHDVEFF